MNSQILQGADIGPALLKHVVQVSSGNWPRMEIITQERQLHLLEIQEVPMQQVIAGQLTFIMFVVKEPIGRPVTVIWPPEGVESPALGIIGLEVHVH